jgi:hypothetical protein
MRRFDPRVALGGLCAAGLLAGPATAGADAPWSAPQPIGGNCCSQQQLLALPAGGVALAGDTGLTLVQNPGGKPSFTAPVGFTGLVSPTGVLGPLALVGGGRTVEEMMPAGVAGIRTFGTTGTAETLSPAAGRPGHTLKGSSSLNIPQAFVVATTADAVLLRQCSQGCGGANGLEVTRLAGGRWSKPRAITRPSTAVAAGGALTTMTDGTIAVAYQRNHAIYVRRLSPSGSLSPAQRVGIGVQSEISIASTGGRRLAVAWAWQRIDEGDAESPFTAHVACSTSIGHFSGRSRQLASIPITGDGDYVSVPGLSLGQDAERRVTLAWTGYAGNRFVVQTSRLTASCATAPQTIALPGADGVLGALAVAPSGRATIAILGGAHGSAPGPDTGESVHGILAAQRPSATAAFAAPVQVSAPDAEEIEPAVAIDATSGRSVLAWRDVASSIELASAP